MSNVANAEVLYCYIYFIVVVWNQTCNISKVRQITASRFYCWSLLALAENLLQQDPFQITAG